MKSGIVKCLSGFGIALSLGEPSTADAIQVGELGPKHAVRLLVQRGYFPGIPVLVRVELRNAAGLERDLWDTDATLSSDQGAVTLSTNRIRLRNGMGSALVTFTGESDFNLSATVGTRGTSKELTPLTGAPVTQAGGVLAGPNVAWSGIIHVTNDVTVPAGVTLTINAGTLVLIEGVGSGTAANDFFISGKIESLGTEENPVTITCANAGATFRWGQIRHDSAQLSLYRYTSISRAGRAPAEGHTGTAPVLRPTGSAIRFENCSITDHAEGVRGAAGFGGPGKIAQASSADLTFIDCLLQRARMGPEIGGTALACTNTWIMDMNGPDDADGIYLHDQGPGQSVTLSGCVLARGDDDGIDTLGSIVTVENCIVREWDSVLEDAKGLSIFNGATHITRSLIVNCTVGIAAKWSGGAPTLVTIEECAMNANMTNVLANRKSNAPGPFIDFRITNSVLWGGDSVQSDFGPTNFTIGYCDISESWPGTGNINANPLFVNAAAHDFHLLPFSPCIDAGNPASPVDPDGSPADMGCFVFRTPAPTLTNARSASGGFEFLLSAYTNRNYVLEVSSNLVSWSGLKTNFQRGDQVPISDAASAARAFYRARVAP